MEHLEKYFDNSQKTGKIDEDLCLLCIQCFEVMIIIIISNLYVLLNSLLFFLRMLFVNSNLQLQLNLRL